MAVRITHISPKPNPVPEDKIQAHLSIGKFKWINEQTFQVGESDLMVMVDWIVNKRGVAYVSISNEKIPVFGAMAEGGRYYLRCLRGGAWSDELLSLPEFH